MKKTRTAGAVVATIVSVVMIAPIITIVYVSALGGSVVQSQFAPAFFMAVCGLIPVIIASYLWSNLEVAL
jgi:hypothetical protein